ncbi:ATP-dependent helicase [Planctellipticum variicoloris]|uniref:ATP-dependent helicase n=1 Tax=Planctellipticum variicoloris TaxID=3064265 RepID=UPI003013FD6F|nr:UvrD-helicase domain-containing protein [Planctomycetaceae bacterium SH412]
MSAADDLTPSQREAVEHFEGPLLVLAGPGSGKTRVITRRIARLIERGVDPRAILAITFTNKASREMAERVQKLLPGSRVWVSTFHRFCARMLREQGRAVGLEANFSIFDTSEQHQLLKQVLHDQDIDATHFPPAKVGQRISQAKNELITPERYREMYQERVGDHFQSVVSRVYPEYQKRLLAANAVDFDDLLVHMAILLQQHEELRRMWDRRFRFVLVDEYQDTNRAQYQIVAQLSQELPNLCATGDPDQSIYGWRGAQIENILRFERDFPQVRVVRLEDNFRSTPEILRAADTLIAHNRQRKHKTLKSNRPAGAPVEFRRYDDGRQEADSIAAEIHDLVKSGQRRWSDFAIFYRVNALSRSLETSLARRKIPFQLAGGVAFYERSEVKDLLAYLRLIENPQDRAAFQRVVNVPTRGIGKTSLDRMLRWSDEVQIPMLEVARSAGRIPKLPKRAAAALRQFADLIDELAHVARTGLVVDLLQAVLARTGYGHHWTVDASEEDMQRKSNVDELISAARQYDEQTTREPANDIPALTGFLESASLAQDLDSLDAESGAVTLMTLHAAKGLEFPCVYLVAVEQNLIPHERSLRNNDPSQLEEERRLLFVGITRAEESLVLTHTLRRELHGRSLSTIPSDFFNEVDAIHRDCGGTDFPLDDVEEEPARPLRAREKLPPATTVADKADRLSALRAAMGDGRPLLTTGAALQSGVLQAAELPQGFALGMQVRHPRYGLGTVVEVSGMSRHRTVTVEFAADERRESFIAAKCPLQPVGLR